MLLGSLISVIDEEEGWRSGDEIEMSHGSCLRPNSSMPASRSHDEESVVEE